MIKFENLLIDYSFNIRSTDHITADNEDVQNIAKNIDENGLLQPIIIRQLEEPKGSLTHQVIAGFTRAFICKEMLAWTEIPCKDVGIINDLDAKAINASENFQRRDITFADEVRGLKSLWEDFQLTEQQMADLLGKSRNWLRARTQVFKMPEAVMQGVEEKAIKPSDVYALSSLFTSGNEEKMYEAVRILREAQQKGGDAKIASEKVKRLSAENRGKVFQPKKSEMEKLMPTLMDNWGEGPATAVLAWCMGGISTEALRTRLEAYFAEEYDMAYFTEIDESLFKGGK